MLAKEIRKMERSREIFFIFSIEIVEGSRVKKGCAEVC
jgi:hypothetical protein